MRTREEERYDAPDDDAAMIEGVCEGCGCNCHGVTRDEGIGRFECHGHIGNHHEYVVRSNCCGARIGDSEGGDLD